MVGWWRGNRIWVSLLIWCVTAAVYLPTTSYDFLLFDDGTNVSHNEKLNPPSLKNTFFFWKTPVGLEYLPVAYSAWSAIAAITRPANASSGSNPSLNPSYFHLVNIVLQASNAVLVFLILNLILEELLFAGKPLIFAAASGALFFALHPVQVEAVSWITGLKDLLSGFFGWLAIYSFLKGRSDTKKYGLLATLFFILAILTKPSLVALPAILGVIVLFVLRRPFRENAPYLGAWLMLSVPVILINRREQLIDFNQVYPWLLRFKVATDALTFYIKKIFYPFPLLIDYGHSIENVAHSWSLRMILLPLALLVLAGLAPSRRFWLSTLALFLIGVSPTLGLIPFQFQYFSTVTDRYLYLSVFAVSFGLAFLLARHGARWAYAGIAILLACYAPLTMSQEEHWKNTQSLAEHTLENRSDSPIGHNLEGMSIFHQDPIAATEHYRFAAHSGDYWGARFNFIQALEYLNRWDEAITEYKAVLETKPHAPGIYVRIGRALMKMNRYAEAVSYFRQTLALQNESPSAAFDELASAQFRSGDFKGAERTLVEGSRHFPDDETLYVNLGMLLKEQRRIADALVAYKRALEHLPHSWLLRTELAGALLDEGKIQDAIYNYQTALAVRPNDAALHYLLGRALDRNHQVPEARIQYQKALLLAPGYKPALEGMARLDTRATRRG